MTPRALSGPMTERVLRRAASVPAPVARGWLARERRPDGARFEVVPLGRGSEVLLIVRSTGSARRLAALAAGLARRVARMEHDSQQEGTP
jgi:hypothetical protein